MHQLWSTCNEIAGFSHISGFTYSKDRPMKTNEKGGMGKRRDFHGLEYFSKWFDDGPPMDSAP